MAQSNVCLGHIERDTRRKKINRLLTSPVQPTDENLRVLIKKGPVSVETSLKELEEKLAIKSDWKVIDEGGVLSIPDVEFRMINPPKPDRSGKIDFGKRKVGAGRAIEGYPTVQTVANINEQIKLKYNAEKEKAK